MFGAVLAAADRAGVGIVVLEVAPALRAVFVSSRCAQILGLSVDELLQRPPLELFPRARLAEIQQILDRHRAGDSLPPTFESRIRRPDGREVALEFGIGGTEIDGHPGSVVFMRDATEAAEAKLTLRRSEARMRTLIECAPDGIVISRDRRIVYANPAAAALLDCERPEDLRGKSFAEILPEDELRVMGERLSQLRPGGPPIGAHEYRARSLRGRDLVVEVTSVLFDDLDGPAVLGFARDVTERRRLQAQLVRADRLAALGTLAAGVAHEINNPLGFIQLALENIEARIGRPGAGLDDGVVPALLADVRHGVERIAAITRQLHPFVRADDERAPARQAAALHEVLSTVCRMAEVELRDRGTLVRSFGALPAVRGDAGRLEQVFLNLLINAVQALDPARAHGRVEVRARVEGDRVLVLVSDNGVGISPENLRHVYDPFFTTKPVGAGTGLGLSVSHSILTQLGGEIGIDSHPNQGTTVRVSLPVAEGGMDQAVRPLPPQPASGRRRILVVDDEEMILRVLERCLGDEHDLVAVSSGDEAVRQVREGQFDLLLLDLMMPGTGGVELCELMARERPELLAKVVVMTGGFASDTLEIAAVKVPVLRKPFSIRDVEAMIASG